MNRLRYPQRIDPTAFVAPTATLLGDVTVGPQSSVWFGAVVRADVAPITIGARTNIQDGAILHADEDEPCVIGDGVTVGHGAVIHSCTVEDDCLIGIRAVVLDRAVIGRGSIVGAGAVVTVDTVVPPGSLVLGIPARIVRSLLPDEIAHNRDDADLYVDFTHWYLDVEV